MIAGLLGEHLASPRTALKTNQNTALEPKPAPDGDSSNGEEFAAYVADTPKPEQASQSSSDDQRPDERAASAAREIAGSDQAEQRADARVEAETKTLPVPVSTPADGEGLNIRQAETAETADLTFTTAAQTAQTEAERVASDVSAPAGQSDPRARIEAIEAARTGDVAADQNIKFDQTLENGREISDRETKRLLSQTLAEGAPRTSANISIDDVRADLSRAASNVEVVDGALTRIAPDAENIDASARITATTQAAAGDFMTLLRDGGAAGPDAIMNLGPATTTTGPQVTTPTGLTPVAPAIPVASPHELTGIIMNAIQNGMDPQEQLIVQLDPPELGRIMIDFKFDAQGLQQIVVTSENPEALKRLREMHAELTAALQEQGLTGENLSFQQDARDRSQTNWGNEARSDRELIFSASDEGRTPRVTGVSEPGSTIRTRLDLVL